MRLIRIQYVPPSSAAPIQDQPWHGPAPGAGAPANPYQRENAAFSKGPRSRLRIEDVGQGARARRNERDSLALSREWRALQSAGPGPWRTLEDATTRLDAEGRPNLAALKQARQTLRAWMQRQPELGEAAKQRLNAADAALARLIRRNAPPGDPGAPVGPGEELGSKKSPWAWLAERRPRSAAELQRAAAKAWKAERRDEAIALLEQASERAPKDAQLHFQRARLLAEEGYYMDAEWALLSADELKPHQAPIQAALGELYTQMGQPAMAIEAFKRTVKLDPAHTDAHAHLGVALYEAEQLGEAAGHLQRAVALDQQHVVARYYLAQIALQENDLLRARFQLTMVSKLAPQIDLQRFGEAAPPALSRQAAGVTGPHHWKLPRRAIGQ